MANFLTCKQAAQLIEDISSYVEARFHTSDTRVTVTKAVLLSLHRQNLTTTAGTCQENRCGICVHQPPLAAVHGSNDPDELPDLCT